MQAVYEDYIKILSQKLRYMVGIVSMYLLAVSVSDSTAFAVENRGVVKVASASNFLLPLRYLKAKFEQQFPYQLKVSAGSTAKLYAQVLNGAPYDVFLAADDVTTSMLVKQGLSLPEGAFLYAQGQLVLWGPNEKYQTPELLKQDFISAKFSRLAMANPKTAPYGRAATEVMSYFELKVKRNSYIYGESVGQAFQFTASGNVDMGFVALSQILSNRRIVGKAVDGKSSPGSYWLPPEHTYKPIYQHGIVLKESQRKEGVRAFVGFLKSPETQKILRQRFGYL